MTIHYLFTIRLVIPKKKDVEREVLENAVPLTLESAEVIEDALNIPSLYARRAKGLVCLICIENGKGKRGLQSRTFANERDFHLHLRMKHGIKEEG